MTKELIEAEIKGRKHIIDVIQSNYWTLLGDSGIRITKDEWKEFKKEMEIEIGELKQF